MRTTFNVLIVDDDEDDQFLIKAAFEKDSAKYNLHFALDGIEVLNDLNNPRFLPDLVILDLNMPIMNGFELLRHLKGSTFYQHVPILILTTSDSENDVKRAYELGANTFLTKPVGHQDLIELAQHIRQYWFSLAKIPKRPQE